MRRIVVMACAAALLAMPLTGCSAKYEPTYFIGKTSEEITSQYGPFDFISLPAGKDGLYRNCRCGYTVKEREKGFLGTSEEVLFFITFDENGAATVCEKGNRPGG